MPAIIPVDSKTRHPLKSGRPVEEKSPLETWLKRINETPERGPADPIPIPRSYNSCMVHSMLDHKYTHMPRVLYPLNSHSHRAMIAPSACPPVNVALLHPIVDTSVSGDMPSSSDLVVIPVLRVRVPR